MGPAGPPGSAGQPGQPGPPGPPGSDGGLKLVDSNGQVVGPFQYPQFVVIQVAGDLVWVVVDMKSRLFEEDVPSYYYATSDCSGPAMMYVDLFRWGVVQGGVLKYPQGNPTPMIYNSILDSSGCNPSTNAGSGEVDTFAPAGSASLAQFVGPFRISK